MTITEEQKEKVVKLYNKGINKIDIKRITTVSLPKIRDILKGNEINDDSGELQEKAEQTEKTLTEIFRYEKYTKESVLELVFNLKRIAKISGKDLGAFVEELSIIFDQYIKYSPNPIKLFDYLLGISDKLSLIYDKFEPKPFNEIVDLYYDKGIFIKEADDYLAQSKTEKEDIIAELKEMWNDFQKRIKNAKKEATKEVEMKSKTILKNSKEAYAEYNEKIDSAKKDLEAINIARTTIIEELEKKEKIETENLELRKLLEQTDKENSFLKVVLQRISAVFPKEIESIWSEIQHEQSE